MQQILMEKNIALPCIKDNELFYIYDESMKKIGVKERKFVHLHGDWHKGIQLNIICNDEILLQRRSEEVDIGKNLIDQSLATQLIVDDEEDEIKALIRGLREELGITPDLEKIRRVVSNKKITKRYEYDSSLYNREFVALFEWHLNEKKDFYPNSNKVRDVFWMKIEEVKKAAEENPWGFTKTFYMWLTEYM